MVDVPLADTATTNRFSDERRSSLLPQCGVIVAAFAAYMGVRALAIGSEGQAIENAGQILQFERNLGIDVEDNMQQYVLDRSALQSFFNAVYAWLYWPMIIGTFIFTWTKRRDLFVLFRNAMLYSGAVGLSIFAIYPVAPPRFMDGFVDTVEASDRSHFIAHPSFLINNYAAMPSFHIGWVALASAILILATDRRLPQLLALIPPALMSVAVVVTGNHYLIDIVAGLAICFGALAVANTRASATAASDYQPTLAVAAVGRNPTRRPSQ